MRDENAGTLVRVVAPHFVAGFIISDDRVTKTAPILGWALGRSRDELSSYFRRKGWRAHIITRRES